MNNIMKELADIFDAILKSDMCHEEQLEALLQETHKRFSIKPSMIPVTHYYDYNSKTICGLVFKPKELTNERYLGSPGKGYTYYIKRLNANITSGELDAVNCPKCLKELKKRLYYCPTHGFISGSEVTFDEKCAICGNAV